MIIPVIMAGGVGSRLWPVSRELFPKQFIAFQQDADSLFQQTLSRLEGVSSLGRPVVVCNQDHRFLVAEQLRRMGVEEAGILLEPVGRNTAPAVAVAAMEAQRQDPEAVLLVLAADHLIEDVAAFQSAVSQAVAQAGQGRLATFGIVPQRAETGYGYIRRGGALDGGVFEVASFVEKPDQVTAQAYLDSGEYYWNSGMFVFRADRYLAELERCSPQILSACRAAFDSACDDLDFKRLPEAEFSRCPSDSIDYAVMEHTRDAVVVPLDAGWNDLGAWSALWECGEQDEQGNVTNGDALLHEVSNSFVHAESRLVSVVGMDDSVVIETSDAVLVARKDRVQDVKEIVKRLNEAQRSEANMHRLVHRPWGTYENLVSGEGLQVKRIIVEPGCSLSLQMHHHRAEHWVVCHGTARVTNGDKVFLLHENQSTYIPAETRHRLENPADDPVVLIEVQCGSYLGEDDIVRFEDDYNRQEPVNEG